MSSKLLSLVGCRRPRRRVTKTFDEWSEAFEIAIPRNQRDASLATRSSNQRVVEKRWLFVEQLPTAARSNSREYTTALGKGGAGGTVFRERFATIVGEYNPCPSA